MWTTHVRKCSPSNWASFCAVLSPQNDSIQIVCRWLFCFSLAKKLAYRMKLNHFDGHDIFSHLWFHNRNIYSSGMTFYASKRITIWKKINKVNLSLNQWPHLLFFKSLRSLFLPLFGNDQIYIKSCCENVIFVLRHFFLYIALCICCFDMEMNSETKSKRINVDHDEKRPIDRSIERVIGV